MPPTGHGVFRHSALRRAADPPEQGHPGGVPEAALLPRALRPVHVLPHLQPAHPAVRQPSPGARDAVGPARIALREPHPDEAAPEVLPEAATARGGVCELDPGGAEQHPDSALLRQGVPGAAAVHPRPGVRGEGPQRSEPAAEHDAAAAACDQRDVLLCRPVLRRPAHHPGPAVGRGGDHPGAGHAGLHERPHRPLRHPARDSRRGAASSQDLRPARAALVHRARPDRRARDGSRAPSPGERRRCAQGHGGRWRRLLLGGGGRVRGCPLLLLVAAGPPGAPWPQLRSPRWGGGGARWGHWVRQEHDHVSAATVLLASEGPHQPGRETSRGVRCPLAAPADRSGRAGLSALRHVHQAESAIRCRAMRQRRRRRPAAAGRARAGKRVGLHQADAGGALDGGRRARRAAERGPEAAYCNREGGPQAA
mmetsp:Transcript_53074/g.151334  ORF Transcript_53074/g.151334 Transcript_53074/m.151334 type:complete len:424 (-) Transcript_53074:344-1615(-)